MKKQFKILVVAIAKIKKNSETIDVGLACSPDFHIQVVGLDNVRSAVIQEIESVYPGFSEKISVEVAVKEKSKKKISSIEITKENDLFVSDISFFDSATVFQDKSFQNLIKRMLNLLSRIDMALCPLCQSVTANPGLCQACEFDSKN